MLSQETRDIPVTEIEAIVEPDRMGNDIWRKTVALVGIRRAILLKPDSKFVSTGVYPGSEYEPVRARV